LNLNFLAAMLAMVNPIDLIPIWYYMTGDATPKVRRKIALMVSGTSFFTLLIFCNFWKVYFGFF
tara:strand:+ start:77765 stop:77956 length:192 start_codon:yes stop_codon:yes gene_type:complete